MPTSPSLATLSHLDRRCIELTQAGLNAWGYASDLRPDDAHVPLTVTERIAIAADNIRYREDRRHDDAVLATR